MLIEDLDEAEAAADQIGYPIVIKVCAAEAAHKTEQGLIDLGINDKSELKQAYKRLSPKPRDLGGEILVQAMVMDSRELVIGKTRDFHIGPCVMFGVGGIFTEVLADVSLRMTPLTDRDVQEMTGEIKSRKLLESVRGLKAIDMEMLCRCLKALYRGMATTMCIEL